mmetsp:Transcript_18475/g.30954  ORF Transcript_18475/g.30954 Transcript_18475/m.30954 type:complete len:527 (+) Transcript_18475:43-1623(+)|eukprot:CAMPEP_0174969582 /NCGR_PEP_ID=MMETSP0004_2-20121128/8852_1 /TAXON_ID=420556 /ORGANISM="Ochromonas sp., Strain CCMP1393" /LENGTH=526 /DNA_ID=CAMNT_0016219107 /DNA_START=43 /DNA_END=1623 /DNA_ORIENTATION=-
MDDFRDQLNSYVKSSYVNQGLQNEKARKNQIQILLHHKKMPPVGWKDQAIELLIHEISVMDSNNFSSNTGVGEREGRVFSQLVARRHFNLAHGIGRSGDIAEVQPKAAGSSVIYKITNNMVTHAMEVAGISSGMTNLVFPMATGMTLTMCMIAMKKQGNNIAKARYVIWPRIDQKSCFKSISTAGLIPLVVENVLVDGEMRTDCAAIRKLLEEYCPQGEILCVLSTTSCFAPRQPDAVDEIAVLCKQYGVGHIINNAYGLQCARICKQINRAVRVGVVDAIVQSTDKNFLVPVGGAIVMSPSQTFIDCVSSSYPGRASMAPVLDLFVTLLSMGEQGYRRLLQERIALNAVLQQGLKDIIVKHPQLSLLPSPGNTISTAISLRNLVPPPPPPPAAAAAVKLEAGGKAASTGSSISNSTRGGSQGLTFLGSMLYQRCVSGCRVVECTEGAAADAQKKRKMVAGHSFCDWGSHHDEYPDSYFTVACAIGIQAEDIELFLQRLDKVLIKYKKDNGIPAVCTGTISSPTGC